MIRINVLATVACLCLAGASVAAAADARSDYGVIWRLADQPKEKGPFLGVSASPAPPVVRDQLKLQPGVGLVVDFVAGSSPAATAGLRQNDVLEKLDDQLLINPQQLAVLVRTHKAGDEVKLSIIREAQPQVLTAKLVEHDVPPLSETFQPTAPLQLRLDNPSGPMYFAPSQSGGLTFSDAKHTLEIVRNGGDVHLIARDAATGKTLYDGPINNPQQWSKLPQGIWEKVKALTIDGAATQPTTNQAMEAARRAAGRPQPTTGIPIQVMPAPAPDHSPQPGESRPTNPPS